MHAAEKSAAPTSAKAGKPAHAKVAAAMKSGDGDFLDLETSAELNEF